MRTIAALVFGASVLAGAPSPKENAAAEPEWEELFTEEGIKVWKREIPGTSLVEFRGRGLVEAPIRRLAAIIRHDERKVEWMQNCVNAFTVEHYGPGHMASYNRTGSPVPLVSDRDVVVEGKTQMFPAEKRVLVHFEKIDHAKMPPIDGVVRMPRLRGYWDMKQIDGHTTELTYQIQADPGGLLPKWVVNWASKKLPYHTIANARKQVVKDGYEIHQQILEASLDWTGFGP